MSKLTPLIVLAWLAVMLSAPSARVEAKVPEPAECVPFATVGVQAIFRCEDPDTGILCFANNYGFLQCLQP